MKGDGSNRRERRVTQGDAVGNRNDQVAGNKVGLGMIRVADPAAGHALTRLKLRSIRTDRGDDAGDRVPERRQGIQLVHHLVERRHQSLLLDGLKDFLHLVGPGLRLFKEGHLPFTDLHALRACRDQAEARLQQNASAFERGRTALLQTDLAGLIVLRNLFHKGSFSGDPSAGQSFEYLLLIELRNDETEFACIAPGNRVNIFKSDSHAVPQPEARFAKNRLLVLARVRRLTHDPEHHFLHRVLHHLRLHDAPAVFEKMIETPTIRPSGVMT